MVIGDYVLTGDEGGVLNPDLTELVCLLPGHSTLALPDLLTESAEPKIPNVNCRDEEILKHF